MIRSRRAPQYQLAVEDRSVEDRSVEVDLLAVAGRLGLAPAYQLVLESVYRLAVACKLVLVLACWWV